MNFWTLFGLDEKRDASRNLGSLFQSLNELLSEYSEEQVQLISGLSGLLGKVAYADKEISDDELETIKEILTREAGVEPALYDSILSLVQHHTVELSGIEDSRYSQIINDVCTPEEKIGILNCLFAVAAANQKIDSDEERELALIAKALRISQKEIANTRTRFREFISVLN